MPKACPICREEHEPRGLSFDGKGINGCGMYGTRIATFISGSSDDETALLGPMFAAAPELLAALKRIREAFYVNGKRHALMAALHGTQELIASAEGR